MRAIIVKPLLRNKLIVGMLVMQISVAFAIVSNSAQIVLDMYRAMTIESGMEDDKLVVLTVLRVSENVLTADDYSRVRTWAIDSGVIERISFINTVPISTHEWTVAVSAEPNGTTQLLVSQYVVDEGFVDASGVRLHKGRDFVPEEFGRFDGPLPRSPSTLITADVERALFPGAESLGQFIYIGSYAYRVVGVLDRLARPSVQGSAESGHAIVLPAQANETYSRYALARTTVSPEQAMGKLTGSLEDVPDNLAISTASYLSMRATAFDKNRYLFFLMIGVLVFTVTIGWLGIHILTSLWIKQRSASYAIRRVVGATRRDIFFLVATESQIVSVIGCLLGLVFAIALSILCVAAYAVEAVSESILFFTFMLILLSGFTAAISPALRASRFDLGAAMKTLV